METCAVLYILYAQIRTSHTLFFAAAIGCVSSATENLLNCFSLLLENVVGGRGECVRAREDVPRERRGRLVEEDSREDLHQLGQRPSPRKPESRQETSELSFLSPWSV